MFISCGCCVLSGRSFCDGPINRLEESYWMCMCLIECDIETSKRRPRLDLDCFATEKKEVFGRISSFFKHKILV
jgi:hypothetical protein